VGCGRPNTREESSNPTGNTLLAVEPLVTVGIPTYNRAVTVERAVRSALAQDHPAIEVVVSDDASTDETYERMQGIAASDPRLRVLRQDVNLGHALNYQAVLDAARGEYFMWLSDDDRIDPTYVSRCLSVLRAEPGHALVAGLARYHSRGEHVTDERPTDLLAARAGARVLAFIAGVNVNGALFGLGRREAFARRGFPDEIGGDWMVVAALAAQGRVRTLRDVHVHRSLDGLGSDEGALARSFGLRGFAERQPHVVMAAGFAREISSSPVYGMLSRPQRAMTAALAAALIVIRFVGGGFARKVLGRAGLGEVEARLAARLRRRDHA
jgi:hypothetical protein